MQTEAWSAVPGELPSVLTKRRELTKLERQIQAKIPLPLKDEPFSLGEIRAAVPKELFEFDMFTSWYYIVKDLVQVAATAAVAYFLLEHVVGPDGPGLLRALIWCLHAFVQGTTGFGLWVIGHECGHQAYFGRLKTLNNTVGLVIHSCFLVPFHSWRITHGTHHKYTNNIQKDTAFPPMFMNLITPEMYEDVPVLQLISATIQLVFGYPLYLMMNFAGQWYPNHSWVNHFNPNAPMFKKSERMDIIISDAGFAAFCLLLGVCCSQFGAANVFLWYGMPYCMTNIWLVCITMLQHNSLETPFYDDNEWTFVKGALSTIDRDYGWIFNEMMHNITDAHVCHHIFSTMPFYNAKKATPYLQRKLGEHYHVDRRPFFVQFLEAVKCRETSYIVRYRYPIERNTAHMMKNE